MRVSVPGPRPSRRRAARAVARLGLAVLLGLALLLGPVPGAQAASVTELYLLSTFSTIPAPSGIPLGVTAPFILTGTGGVKLGLTSGVATSQTGFSGSVSAYIDSTVTYQSHSGTIDSGEGGTASWRVNSEVSRLDDVGLVTEGTDAKLNVDFSDHAKVIFKIPTVGFMKLIIAEDAGLDPFKLERCDKADCSGTRQVLFDGFTSATKNDVLALPDFGGGDSSPIDQVWLFLFDAPLDGWLRISETRNFGGTRLEVDFVGGLDQGVVGPAAVPEPTTFLLWGTTAAGLALARWRRRYRAAQ